MKRIRYTLMGLTFFGFAGLGSAAISTQPPAPTGAHEDCTWCVCPAEACVPKCTFRNIDGACFRWETFCGRGASCAKQCEAYNIDGSCARWGQEDVCSELIPPGC